MVSQVVDPASPLFDEGAVTVYSDYLDHLSVQSIESGRDADSSHLARLVAAANNPAVDPATRLLRTYVVTVRRTYGGGRTCDMLAHTGRQAIQRATGYVDALIDEPVRDGDDWVATYTASADSSTVRWVAE